MIDLMIKDVIEKVKISDDLIHEVSVSQNKNTIFLTVSYKKGKFTINKTFINNFDGNASLTKIRKELSDENKVKAYLGL